MRLAIFLDVVREVVVRRKAPRPIAFAVTTRDRARCTVDREVGKGDGVMVGLVVVVLGRLEVIGAGLAGGWIPCSGIGSVHGVAGWPDEVTMRTRLFNRGGMVGMKTLVPLTAPLAARALVVMACCSLHPFRRSASSCRYLMRCALSLAEPTEGKRFRFWLSL